MLGVPEGSVLSGFAYSYYLVITDFQVNKVYKLPGHADKGNSIGVPKAVQLGWVSLRGVYKSG